MRIEESGKSEPSLCLADYTGTDLTISDLVGEDVPGVVQELCQVLRNAQRIPDLLPFYHAVLVREYLVNTVVGSGVAFPHARLHGIERPCFAFGRSQHPIRWGSNDCTPVRLVFLSAVPATDAADYLCLLSALTRLSKEPAHVEQLKQAESSAQILAVLKQVRVRASSPASLP